MELQADYATIAQAAVLLHRAAAEAALHLPTPDPATLTLAATCSYHLAQAAKEAATLAELARANRPQVNAAGDLEAAS